MRAQFLNLYKKELREVSTFSILFACLSIGWYIFLVAMRDWWSLEVIFGISFIPLGLLPFFLILQGFTSFRSEWKDDTIYAVLSLPVPGWFFTASKFLASMTAFTLLSLLTMGGVFVIGRTFIQMVLASVPSAVGFGWFWKAMIFCYVFVWFGCAVLYIISQFSYLVSRLFSRMHALVSGVVAILSYWFVLRVSGWVSVVLSWIPDYSVDVWNYVNGVYHTQVATVPVYPWITALLLVIGLGYAGSLLLERILEV